MHNKNMPLLKAQEGIWVGQQLDPENPLYWTAEWVELHGPLDVVRFQRAVQAVLDDCEALHMRYAQEAQQLVQCHERKPWSMLHLDCSNQAETDVQHWIQNDLQTPVNLTEGPLFHTVLMHLGPLHHGWYFRSHHIALDGYAYALLLNQVAQAYGAEDVASAVNTASSVVPFRAVLEEEQAYGASSAFQKDQQFWRERLGGQHDAVSWHPPVPLARDVLRHAGQLEQAGLEALQDKARQCGVDWGVWMLSVVALCLYRSTGAQHITLGLPVMNRLGSVSLTVPCMTMNIIPLPLCVEEGMCFEALLAHVQTVFRQVRPHQRYRYEQLKHDLGMKANRARLFGPVVNLMPFDRPVEFDGLQVVHRSVSSGPVEDLAVILAPTSNGLRFDLEANPSAYTVEDLRRCHQVMLDTVHQSLLAPHTLVSAFPAWALNSPAGLSVLKGPALLSAAQPVLEAFRQQAIHHPERMALSQDGHVPLSYAQLLCRIQTQAGQLRERGIGQGDRVLVMLPRSPQAVVSIWAVLWCGASYIPLDPAGPRERLQQVLMDAAPSLVLTESPWALRVPSDQPVWCLDAPDDRQADLMPLPAHTDADAVAYVMYTSGSTGKPNGVMVSHRALDHFVAAANQRYTVNSNDRVLQFAPLHFDASVEEMFMALCHGASLVLRTDAMLESMPAFVEACERQQITVLDLPTAFWHEWAYALGCGRVTVPSRLRLVVIGGEAALPERLSRWVQHVPSRVQLLNTYGPTEATVICSVADFTGTQCPQGIPTEGALSIGDPLAGLQLYVVDERMRLVPQGQAGDLCISGPTLALGYLNREALSAKRFVRLHHVWQQPKTYRTGDRVQLHADGRLVYLGRLDDELKISGHRINPAEIEAAMLGHPSIKASAVLGQRQTDGPVSLVAFCVVNEALNVPALRAWLSQHLPAPAIPTVFHVLEHLPLNANGKVDRTLLRKRLSEEDVASEANTEEALGLIEGPQHEIAQVYADVLGLKHVSVHADFFALGGSSLQVIQVSNRLSSVLQREVPVSMVFQHATPGALAEALEAQAAYQGHRPPQNTNPFSPLITLQRGLGPAVFCIHPAEGLSWCYWGLCAHLPSSPLYGLQAEGLTGRPPQDMHTLLDNYQRLIQTHQPQGPYRLLGWSSGGGIAHALACRLQQQGHEVDLLALLDAYPSHAWAGQPLATERQAWEALLDVTGDASTDEQGKPLSIGAMQGVLTRKGSPLAGFSEVALQRMVDTGLGIMHQYRSLAHSVFHGDILFFQATQRAVDAPDWKTWVPHVSGNIHVTPVNSTHAGLSQRKPLGHIGLCLAQALETLSPSFTAAPQGVQS